MLAKPQCLIYCRRASSNNSIQRFTLTWPKWPSELSISRATISADIRQLEEHGPHISKRSTVLFSWSMRLTWTGWLNAGKFFTTHCHYQMWKKSLWWFLVTKQILKLRWKRRTCATNLAYHGIQQKEKDQTRTQISNTTLSYSCAVLKQRSVSPKASTGFHSSLIDWCYHHIQPTIYKMT